MGVGFFSFVRSFVRSVFSYIHSSPLCVFKTIKNESETKKKREEE